MKAPKYGHLQGQEQLGTLSQRIGFLQKGLIFFWNPCRRLPGFLTWSNKLQKETTGVNGVNEKFESPHLHADWGEKVERCPIDVTGNINNSLSNSFHFSWTRQAYRTARSFCFHGQASVGRLSSPLDHQDFGHNPTQCLHECSAHTWLTIEDELKSQYWWVQKRSAKLLTLIIL